MAQSTIAHQVAEYFAAFPLRRYRTGEVVILADTPAPLPVYYLQSGMIGQYDVTPGGNRVMCNVFKEGAFFPMSNALNDQPSAYFFEAMTSCEVRVAPSDQVKSWLNREPAIMLDLLARVYRGTDGLIGRMTELMAGTARSRVNFELGILTARFGEALSEGRFFLKITEAQLAAHTGLARETVSRELSALKKSGVVKLERGGLTVDPAQLDRNQPTS